MTRKEFIKTVGGTAVAATLSSHVSAHPTILNAFAKGQLRRGVALYSYQEEYFTGQMSVEDCLSEAASIGAYEIEFPAETMAPDFPNPSDKWVDQWKGWVDKYKLIPATYTQFQDTFITKNHDLTADEGVKMMERDMKLAKRMGFKNMRLLIGTPIDVIEKSIPLAEKYDIWMGCEIHAPCTLDSTLVKKWIEVADKYKTKHFGIIPDFGIFVARPGRVQRERLIRDGKLTASVAEYVESAWEDGVTKEKVTRRVAASSKNPGDQQYVASVYRTKMEDPKLLIPMLPYVRHFHAKFYDMTEDLKEYSIPYETIVPVLLEGGVSASFASEYEGQRHIQDITEPIACEQVRRQHAMLRKVLGEV